MNVNPYTAPAVAVADVTPIEGAPALWNPAAAACWSLLFSPAFGALLHMLNWRALGDTEKAAAAQSWFVTSLVVLAMITACAVMVPQQGSVDGAIQAVGVGYLLLWYFATGRVQVRFVKHRYGQAYPRKAWGKPLFAAVAATLAYFVAVFTILLTLGVGK